jgi:hypothetical protein
LTKTAAKGNGHGDGGGEGGSRGVGGGGRVDRVTGRHTSGHKFHDERDREKELTRVTRDADFGELNSRSNKTHCDTETESEGEVILDQEVQQPYRSTIKKCFRRAFEGSKPWGMIVQHMQNMDAESERGDFWVLMKNKSKADKHSQQEKRTQIRGARSNREDWKLRADSPHPVEIQLKPEVPPVESPRTCWKDVVLHKSHTNLTVMEDDEGGGAGSESEEELEEKESIFDWRRNFWIVVSVEAFRRQARTQ